MDPVSISIISMVVFITMFGAIVLKQRHIASKDKELQPKPKVRSFSKVGQQVVKEFYALPPDSRPFYDIESVVTSLDAITSVYEPDRTRHFDRNWLSSIQKQNGFFDFSWNARYDCGHNSKNCKFIGYWRLHLAIKNVSDSLVEKERAVLESRHSDNPEAIASIEQALKAEADLNRNFIKEFKKL